MTSRLLLSTALTALLFLDGAAISVVQAETPEELWSLRGASWTELPTGRSIGIESDPVDETLRRIPGPDVFDWRATGEAADEKEEIDFSQLLRPRFSFQGEWEPESDGITISSFDSRIRVPGYPVFGPPPPFLSAGFSLTAISAPAELDLPEELYDVSLGLSWMRRINDQWMMRWMAGAAFASDFQNQSSDAWQVRAGVFVIWSCVEHWKFTFGALTIGRADIPVIPAVGAIWEPSPNVRVNLMLPRPRLSFKVFEGGGQQGWLYIGGGLDGGSWAYERTGGIDELVTYREFRVVLGWQMAPPKSFPIPASGLSWEAEVGYVFQRTFEFDRRVLDIDVDDTMIFRTGINF